MCSLPHNLPSSHAVSRLLHSPKQHESEQDSQQQQTSLLGVKVGEDGPGAGGAARALPSQRVGSSTQGLLQHVRLQKEKVRINGNLISLHFSRAQHVLKRDGILKGLVMACYDQHHKTHDPSFLQLHVSTQTCFTIKSNVNVTYVNFEHSCFSQLGRCMDGSVYMSCTCYLVDLLLMVTRPDIQHTTTVLTRSSHQSFTFWAVSFRTSDLIHVSVCDTHSQDMEARLLLHQAANEQLRADTKELDRQQGLRGRL